MTLKTAHFRLQPALTGRLFALGFPMAAQNAIIAVGGMIIQSVVNGYGVAFIGGFTASNKLYGVLEIAATSYGYAMITYAGQNLGAGNHARIRKGMRCDVIVAVMTSVVIAGVMLVFGRAIMGAFISGTSEEVVKATQVGYTYLAIMSICLPVLYILHVTRSAVQGMGNTVLPMVSGIAEFFMRTGGVLLLPGIMGENGVFIAEVLAWVGADLILIPSYFFTIRKVSRR
jgi:Na+-driven multidrug efflux pump